MYINTQHWTLSQSKIVIGQKQGWTTMHASSSHTIFDSAHKSQRNCDKKTLIERKRQLSIEEPYGDIADVNKRTSPQLPAPFLISYTNFTFKNIVLKILVRKVGRCGHHFDVHFTPVVSPYANQEQKYLVDILYGFRFFEWLSYLQRASTEQWVYQVLTFLVHLVAGQIFPHLLGLLLGYSRLMPAIYDNLGGVYNHAVYRGWVKLIVIIKIIQWIAAFKWPPSG